ncbi:MAG: hypothetical protein ACLP8S_25170 [Solirubrobacteraceae bacterium]
MRIRPTFATFAALLSVIALSACGSSASSSGNGVASQSPQQILAAASKAAASLTSVHIAGRSTSSATPIELDVTLASGDGEGTITVSGESLEVRSVGKYLYIKAGSDFWEHYANAAAAKLFSGKWLKAPQSGQFAALAALTDKQQILGEMLAQHGQLAKGGTSTINGQPVVALIDKAKGGGTLYIATTGKPYPIQITGSGASAGKVVFDAFNVPVTISPPAGSIDLTKLS